MTKLEVSLSQLLAILFTLLQIFDGFVSVVLLEVFLGNTLVYWIVQSIDEVLSSHYLHSLKLSLLVHSSCIRVQLLLVDEGLLVGGFVVDFVTAKVKVSLS